MQGFSFGGWFFLPVGALAKQLEWLQDTPRAAYVLFAFCTLSHLVPTWQHANEQPNASVKQGSLDWNLLLWFLQSFSEGVQIIPQRGKNQLNHRVFFLCRGWRNGNRWEEGLGILINPFLLALSSFLHVLVSWHAARSSEHTGSPTLQVLITLPLV